MKRNSHSIGSSKKITNFFQKKLKPNDEDELTIPPHQQTFPEEIAEEEANEEANDEAHVPEANVHDDANKLGPFTTQNVPPTTYKFPKRNKNRSCQSSWFAKFTWLHYVEDKDCVLCFLCHQARYLGRKKSGRGYETAFAVTGFKNWIKAISKFTIHEASDQHVDSCQFLVQRKEGPNVVGLLSKELQQQQENAQIAIRTVISSLRYLARSGQAIRGHAHDGGNLLQLLEERSMDVPVLKSWLQKRDNWISHDIQNEIIQIMAHSVQRQLVRDIQTSPFFSIMADGTTDISGQEQFCLSARYVDPVTLKIRELFLGMFNPPDVTAETLFKTIQTMLIALNLGTDNLRGHCFDGAATMSGRLTGVQKRLSDLQPKSLFIHCSNHSLDLVLQETARKCDLLCDTLALIREVSNAILESAKRRAIYLNIVVRPCSQDQENAAEVVTNIIPLCPTRWTVRVKAMRRFLENYSRIRDTLTAILSDSSSNITDQRKATLRGFRAKMYKFKTLVALQLSISVFGPCEELARALQSPAYTASGAKHSAQALHGTLNEMGSHNFNEAWEYTQARAEELELKMGERLPERSRHPPRRLEQTSSPVPATQLDQKSLLRKDYVAVLDLMKAELHRRFQQPNMDQLVRLEAILLQRSTRLTNNELADALGIHRTDFDVDRLDAQLVLLPSVIEDDAKTVVEIAESLQALPTTTRKLLDQIERLTLLLLTVPACSTTPERSFSALTRLKTRLRSTMSQKRLTHLLLLHIHDEYTKNLCLNDVMKEFVSVTTERRKVFGTVAS